MQQLSLPERYNNSYDTFNDEVELEVDDVDRVCDTVLINWFEAEDKLKWDSGIVQYFSLNKLLRESLRDKEWSVSSPAWQQ